MSSHEADTPDPALAGDTPGMLVPPSDVELHPKRLDVSALYVAEAFVGIWLFLSPWILDNYHHLGALWNGMFLGSVVIIGSIASAAAVSATTEVLADTHHWWGRATIVIGVWLVICSPLIDLDASIVSNVLTGVALITLGVLSSRTASAQIDDAAVVREEVIEQIEG